MARQQLDQVLPRCLRHAQHQICRVQGFDHLQRIAFIANCAASAPTPILKVSRFQVRRTTGRATIDQGPVRLPSCHSHSKAQAHDLVYTPNHDHDDHVYRYVYGNRYVSGNAVCLAVSFTSGGPCSSLSTCCRSPSALACASCWSQLRVRCTSSQAAPRWGSSLPGTPRWAPLLPTTRNSLLPASR